MLRRMLAGLIVFGSVGVASAQQACDPPPGLSPQQWYQICEGPLQQAFAMGYSQGAPWNYFVAYMYRAYAQPAAMMPGPMQGGGSGPMMCQLGQSQCFSGYVRTCQQMATGGTWWVTGAQQCR